MFISGQTLVGGSPASPNIRLDADGSSTFAGFVYCNRPVSSDGNSFFTAADANDSSKQKFMVSRKGTYIGDDVVYDGVSNVFNGNNITLNTDGRIVTEADATIHGVTVGRGGGSVSTNTAVGRDALLNNTTGSENTAVGIGALSDNTEGSFNIALGRQALYKNTTGDQNTALGINTLINNTTGDNNTALGQSALGNNTAGNNGTAIGFDSQNYVNSTTTAFTNTNVSVGYQSLRGSITAANNTGLGNTAIGYQAMLDNTSGGDNTAVGKEFSYHLIRRGDTQLCLLVQALFNVQHKTGNLQHLAVRSRSYVFRTNWEFQHSSRFSCQCSARSPAITTSLSERMVLEILRQAAVILVLGKRQLCRVLCPSIQPSTTENNRIVMGSTHPSPTPTSRVAWTVTSDARDKTNFAPVPHGLDFVKQLEPTQYEFRVDRDSEEVNGPVRYGFKAQDILALEGDNPVIIDADDEDNLKLNTDAIVPVLVNALQRVDKLSD